MRHFGELLFTAGFVAAIGSIAAAPVRAQDCPGNPNAIGTSRVLTLEPGELTRIGVMQYPQTLPLADKEVVITFDDGPLPPYSNQVLDILASECVKATYFLVGEMARAYPATVRRIYEAGHTIGTHSEDHPLRFDRISVDKVRWEIDQGIADVEAALGDPGEVAPYSFRAWGARRLSRTNLRHVRSSFSVPTPWRTIGFTVSSRSRSSRARSAGWKSAAAGFCSCMTSTRPQWPHCPGS